MTKLIEVRSMHEQREMLHEVGNVIKKGIWIEILSFDYHTERVDIYRRWQVVSVKKTKLKDKKKYKIICKELDIDADKKKKEAIAKEIIDKHSERLKVSFAKCLVDGINSKSIKELKGMFFKLGGCLEKEVKKIGRKRNVE